VLTVTADWLIGIGTLIASVAAIISALATLRGNRQVTAVQKHLHEQDADLAPLIAKRPVRPPAKKTAAVVKKVAKR